MDKKFLAKQKGELEKTKEAIEEELKKFAKKDKNLKDDWDTNYPKFTDGENLRPARLEESADEVEEYITLLPIEHNLELRLQKINSALENIKKGVYGKCKKCNKKIPKERLEVYPEAEFCAKCQK
jgi:RNA polymerase-binding transcription factor DksA